MQKNTARQVMLMQSEIKTITYANGEIQKVQVVRWDRWDQLDYLTPAHSSEALDCFADIYRNHLVPAAPWIFGHMVLFQLPGDFTPELPVNARKHGTVASSLTAAAAVLQDGVSIRGGKPVFCNEAAKQLWCTLEQQNCIRIVSGRLPTTKIIPVTNIPGYLSEAAPEAVLKVNASFFIMDCFDCATVYDHVGTPFGLCVKDGRVIHPPLYNREALLVDQKGDIRIRHMDVTDLEMEINGTIFRHGENASIYSRPEKFRAPGGHKQYLIITGCQVAAVSEHPTGIPASGFVLCPREDVEIPAGSQVIYHGLENIAFGIQVGNSILKDGIKTGRFHSRFYNIRNLEPVPFPPSLYPMNFKKSRAARIALGADENGKPVLLWAEGAAKIGYVPGKGSCGASLKEMAELCAQAGMKNAVNLDGGGSAQILVNHHRALQISDRNAQTLSEAERPIPIGLVVR